MGRTSIACKVPSVCLFKDLPNNELDARAVPIENTIITVIPQLPCSEDYQRVEAVLNFTRDQIINSHPPIIECSIVWDNGEGE